MYDFIQRAEDILFSKKTMEEQLNQPEVTQPEVLPVPAEVVESPVPTVEPTVSLPQVEPQVDASNCLSCSGEGLTDDQLARCPACKGTGKV